MSSNSDYVDYLPYTAYVLGQVTYLPDYRIKGLYVGPGESSWKHRPYTEYELKAAGAKTKTMNLWPRSYGGLNVVS